MRSTTLDSTPATGPLDLPFYKGERSSEVHQSRISEVQAGPGRSSEGQRPMASTRPTLPPLARAAGKVSEPASGALPGSAPPRAPSSAPAGSWPARLAVRARGRSSHTGQGGRRQGDPAPRRPASCQDGPRPLRVPGFRPEVPLQAFENSGLTGGVRRRVRSLARGIRPILRLLTARVSQHRGTRVRVPFAPAEAA